jgi:hypothetical protein
MNHEAISKLCRCLVLLLLSIVNDNVLSYRTENKLFYFILIFYSFSTDDGASRQEEGGQGRAQVTQFFYC